jgi:5'-methylthioadenosine phosphorylase
MGEAGTPPVIGVLGGSGLYEIEGLRDAEWVSVDTPFGAPSDAVLRGTIGGQEIVFLPRHARGHRIPPSQVNYRANIYALKTLGVTEILSMSAAGSLRQDIAPGTFVIVDQFVDRTVLRDRSFFDVGLAAHVSMAHPVCARLGDVVETAARERAIPIVRGGVYIAIEGPQFSTRAESELYRSWGCDVIGMTNMPEARLAREAEICYATVAMVTDYDCWHPEDDHVTVETVIRILLDNADQARGLVEQVAPSLSGRARACLSGCHTSLDNAIITAPDRRDPAMVDRLRPLLSRVLALPVD